MLYEYCDAHAVPYKKLGKLVVGREHQRSYLEDLHKKASALPWPKIGSSSSRSDGPAVPTKLLSGDEARDLEPDLSKDIAVALMSSETGIIDTHTYMEALEKDITESGTGSVVCSTEVVRIDPAKDGWIVQMRTILSDDGSEQQDSTDSILARVVINSTGLSAPFILNSLYKQLTPPLPPIPIWYARGSYASYHGPGVSNVRHLIYPVPETGPSAHGFASLGTHLTVDLGGNIKFGPDIEWIEPHSSTFTSTNDTTTTEEKAIDFWQEYLVASSKQIPSFFDSVSQYLPGIVESGLRPDYVGVRPKLLPHGGGFQDFVIKRDFSGRFKGEDMTEDEGGPMISLLGIESPGLTSSLAIAELVDEQLKGF
jgi:L-2-hydroxyglutarate oxidase LhgO